MSPEFLDIDDVLDIHATQLARFGGLDGIRDMGLLESALAQPSASFGAEWLHADHFEMAAAYLYHIVSNHPFLDGNKRTGLICALTFLGINGVEIQCDEPELENMVMMAAKSELSKPEIAGFFRRHIKG
ncbi:MAG: type II toxin-antitoxin system death-on-curing family toxin [Deltaproteobacteria bacterium]|nr:type II toxin-antitoxin system death-on-curing family toxin [Deltaproteobacteria bacterium]